MVTVRWRRHPTPVFNFRIYSCALHIYSSVVSLQSQQKSKKVLKAKGSALNKLNPILKEGLLKVGGRLTNASVDDEAKHPIILPSKHPVTGMIIRQHHAEVGHMGQESVLSSIRKEYWIVEGRAAVKRVIRSCVMCQRRKARLGEQFMASLPQTSLLPINPRLHTWVSIISDRSWSSRDGVR